MALSPNERLADLTNAIIRRTVDRAITWEKTSIDGIYATSIGNYVVHISELPRSAGDPDYCITLYNGYGEVIDKFVDPDLVGYDAPGYDGFFSAMQSLYQSAAQQASGANEAIDDILRILNK